MSPLATGVVTLTLCGTTPPLIAIIWLDQIIQLGVGRPHLIEYFLPHVGKKNKFHWAEIICFGYY